MLPFGMLRTWVPALVLLAGCNSDRSGAQADVPAPPSRVEFFEGALPASAVHGQIVYVPIYSSIYSHSSKRMIELTATLSIHNTDAKRDIFIRSAKYFDTSGKLLEERAPMPIRLAPMQTVSIVVELNDTRGGAGANFVVAWVGEQGARPPVVEAVMVYASLSSALAFASPGRVVETIEP
jgi:hypothetical protein